MSPATGRSPGSPPPRSVQVAVSDLHHALTEAQASLTVQEGLYRAYMAYLRDLDAVDGLPADLRDEIHALLVDLRSAFGFDESTGDKVGVSTLGQRRAAQLLARLEAVSSSADVLAEQN